MSRSTTAAQLRSRSWARFLQLFHRPTLPRSSSFSRKRGKTSRASLSLRECYQIPSVSERSVSFYITDREERKEDERAREKERKNVCQDPVGSHSLHNCSELNSSLVAPPEITLSPLFSTSLFPTRISLFLGVYYVVVAELAAPPPRFVNELGPSSSGFC